MTPGDGVLPGYGRATLEFSFHPRARPSTTGYKSQQPLSPPCHTSRVLAAIECVSTQQLLRSPVSATATAPAVIVCPSLLDFRHVTVHDHAELSLTLCNHSELLAAEWRIPPLPHFHFLPDGGVLAPKESVSLLASFAPNQLGHFRATAHISVEKGITTIDLPVRGNAR